MGSTPSSRQKDHFYAVVDMGSNGIRLSITDLSPPTTRIMPTIYQERVGISLYDAQFQDMAGKSGLDGDYDDDDDDDTASDSSGRRPIPAPVIQEVVDQLRRFKSVCEDFEVPEANVSVLATEATRVAPNSKQFLSAIKFGTGWDVQLLAKEDEGRIGAMGVACSFDEVKGLVMDLGGGSTQLTWMVAEHGQVTISPNGSISMPYGAAALTKRLEKARNEGSETEAAIREEIRNNFQAAYQHINIPQELVRYAEQRGGFDLHLCGGGFRGWGYLIMSQSQVNPYPIPIINGFQADRSEFEDTMTVANIAAHADTKIFRVSKRRTSQVPAVAFLVREIMEALPTIRRVHFCQGGVREGFLYEKLSAIQRKQPPLLVASAPYAPPSANSILGILIKSLPTEHSSQSKRYVPRSFTYVFLSALTNLLFAHAHIPRETRPVTALYSTTVGILASTNSLSHLDRALIALVLHERWYGDLAPADVAFRDRLGQLVSAPEAWWCQYIGRIAALIGDVYPAGRVNTDVPTRISFEAGWGKEVKKKQKLNGHGDVNVKDVLVLDIQLSPEVTRTAGTALSDSVNRIVKLGKKKNWVASVANDGQGAMGEDYGVKIRLADGFRGVEPEN